MIKHQEPAFQVARAMPRRPAGASSSGSRCAWVTESLDFLHMCLAMTPLAEYSRLLELEARDRPGLPAGCVREALEAFGSDLARWDLRPESPAELFRRLQLAPNLQATFFYRLSRAAYEHRVELLPDIIGVMARILCGTEIYYSAEIG